MIFTHFNWTIKLAHICEVSASSHEQSQLQEMMDIVGTVSGYVVGIALLVIYQAKPFHALRTQYIDLNELANLSGQVLTILNKVTSILLKEKYPYRTWDNAVIAVFFSLTRVWKLTLGKCSGHELFIFIDIIMFIIYQRLKVLCVCLLARLHCDWLHTVWCYDGPERRG